MLAPTNHICFYENLDIVISPFISHNVSVDSWSWHSTFLSLIVQMSDKFFLVFSIPIYLVIFFCLDFAFVQFAQGHIETCLILQPKGFMIFMWFLHCDDQDVHASTGDLFQVCILLQLHLTLSKANIACINFAARHWIITSNLIFFSPFVSLMF